MSGMQPDWNEKADERGAIRDPVGSDQSRNRVVNLFSRGLITSTKFRLRYLSIHAWALQELANQSVEDDERYSRLKRIEKLFCLASYYQYLSEDQSRGATIGGMDGVTRFTNFDYEDFEEIKFDEMELLKNDGYAYSTNYENLLQKFLLKRGGFDLTSAGRELAEIVGENLGDETDRILKCAERGYATQTDFEALREPLANQSLYLNSATENERRAFEKILLGFLEWDETEQEGTVKLKESIPNAIPLDLFDELHETLHEPEEMPSQSRLYEKYRRKYHKYRRGYGLFLLRTRQLETETDADPLSLSDTDVTNFADFRELMRIYWMQVYTGYAIESQLEALCMFLNSRIPARYDYDDLLDRATDERVIHSELAGLSNSLSVNASSEDTSSSQLTRDLLLYGATGREQPSVSITPHEPDGQPTVGSVRKQARQIVSDGWDETPPIPSANAYNEVLVGKAIRDSLNELRDNLNNPDKQFEWWTRSLGRSIALLLLCTERFDQLESERNWFFNYANNRLQSQFASLPRLYHSVRRTDPDTPISEFGRTLLDDYVVETHLKVFYNRLGPGNFKRILSFDQDERLCLETQSDRGKRPIRATPSFVRFDEMNIFLRDCGLLTDDDEAGYLVTDRGRELLSQLGDGGGSSK